MGIRDRLVDRAARHQEAMPVSSALGVVSSVVGAVALLALAVLTLAQGSVAGAAFFLLVWLMAVGNLWLRRAGRRRRRAR